MQPRRLKPFEQRLCRRKIADVGEAVVGLFETDACCPHLPLQPVMAVATKLEPKRCPCRNPQVAQTKFRINEVNVEGLAFARTPLELEKTRRRVLAHLEAAAAFDGPKNADNALAPSTHREDLFNESLLALAVVDLSDFDALSPGQRADMVGHLQPELISVALVELHKARAAPAQMLLHRPRPTDGLVGAKEHHPVKALNHAPDVLRMAIHQRLDSHAHSLPQSPACFIHLFGSGFAGLGIVTLVRP
jgi:hypothetical protein